MDYEKARTIPYGKILVRVWKEQLILTYRSCKHRGTVLL